MSYFHIVLSCTVMCGVDTCKSCKCWLQMTASSYSHYTMLWYGTHRELWTAAGEAVQHKSCLIVEGNAFIEDFLLSSSYYNLITPLCLQLMDNLWDSASIHSKIESVFTVMQVLKAKWSCGSVQLTPLSYMVIELVLLRFDDEDLFGCCSSGFRVVTIVLRWLICRPMHPSSQVMGLSL